MLENTSFHEVVLGVAFIVLLIVIGVLLAVGNDVPAELWTFAAAIFGVETGTQVPSGQQRAIAARQADQMTSLVTAVASRPATIA